MKHKKLMRHLWLMLFVVTLNACKREPITPSTMCGGTPVTSHPKAAAFKAIMDKYIRKGLPGISVSIIDNQGQWTSAAGKADIARNINMEPCHLGRIASNTKMVVATLAMKLVEEGKLSLNDPLTRWLPSRITDKLANANAITLLYLLTHQTGLKDFEGDQRFFLDVTNNPAKRWTSEDLLKYVYNQPARFRPGAQAYYTNINTVLAAMMIEGATGRSHAALIREKILEPLRMNNTFYEGHDALPEGNLAQGYYDLIKDNVLENVTVYNIGYGTGAIGLVSNVQDMQLFIRALFLQKTILTQQSLDQMRQWYKDPTSILQYGIGLIRQPIRSGPDDFVYGHGGADLGYTSEIDWYPEKSASLTMIVNVGIRYKASLRSTYYDFYYELANKIAE